MILSKLLDFKNEVVFKRIFGKIENRKILIHFINDVLDLKGNEKIGEVKFLSPVQDSQIAPTPKSLVEVLCKDANGVKRIVQVQMTPQKSFEQSAQHYASEAYSSKYPDLKEIIFIAIVDYMLFPEKESCKSDRVVLDKELCKHTLKDFYFIHMELPKFKKQNPAQLVNMVEKWMYCFKYAEKMPYEDRNKLIGNDLILQRVYDELNLFNWTGPELNAYEQELERTRDHIAVLEFQIGKAKKEGWENGWKEGTKEGDEDSWERGWRRGWEAACEDKDREIIRALSVAGFSKEEISDIIELSVEEINVLRNKPGLILTTRTHLFRKKELTQPGKS